MEKVAPVAEELDREHRFPYELVAEMAELGLMGIPIPEEYGGGGGDTLSYAIAVEELTRIDSSVAITVAAHTSLGTMPIFLFGTEEQKQEWLPDLASGKQAGRVRADRAGRGLRRRRDAHDRRAPRRAVGDRRREDVHHQRRHRHLRLRDDHRADGRRRDLEPDRPERRRPATRSRRRCRSSAGAPPTRASSPSRAARVPEGNLLGPRGEGFKQFLEILDGGRISVAAMGVGLAQGAYDLAYAYALERQQFGKPIASFQAVQFQLADMATEIEAGRALVYQAAWLKDEGRRSRSRRRRRSSTPALLSNRAANIALQIHGGYGFMDEFAISRLYRDQKILEIGEGTNEVQRMVIAGTSACRRRSRHRARDAARVPASLTWFGPLRLQDSGRRSHRRLHDPEGAHRLSLPLPMVPVGSCTATWAERPISGRPTGHYRKTAGAAASVGAAMLFRQFVDEDLGCASYLVGDEDAGEALLVDPAYAIEQYLDEAERHGVRIVRVLETHTHADHVSGHGRLALEHGIPVSIHPTPRPSIPHDPLEDGDELDVGAVALRCHPHARPPARALLLPRRRRTRC